MRLRDGVEMAIIRRVVRSWETDHLQETPRLSEDKVQECVDPRLEGRYPPKAVAKLAAVAAICLQFEAEFRPSMSIVVKALQPLVNVRPPRNGSGGSSSVGH